MKKLAFLIVLALELAVAGCGTGTPHNYTNTQTTGQWSAQLTGGTGEASKLNFVTAFNVINSGTLDITSFGFFNQGACFGNGVLGSVESGAASFTTNISTDQVTGSLSYTVTANQPPGSLLVMTSLPDGLTGTSSGSTSTTGTLSNGVVVGTWVLTGSATCTGGPAQVTGTFLMCQGNSTCVAP